MVQSDPSWFAKRAARCAAGSPSGAADGWRIRPAGWPTGRRPVRRRAMDGPSANPRNPGANPKGTHAGVPSLWFCFSWASKRNERAPPGAKRRRTAANNVRLNVDHPGRSPTTNQQPTPHPQSAQPISTTPPPPQGDPPMTPQSVDLLIEARWIIPVEPLGVVLEHHAVAVDNDQIIAVLPTKAARAAYAPTQTVALPEHVLIPGLVNAHTHNPMTLLRGIADDLPLMTVLEEHI